MKGDIEVLFLNGCTKRSIVDARIAGRVSIVRDNASTTLRPSRGVFSEAAVSLAVSAVSRTLETVFGGGSEFRLSFAADSPKLEELAIYRAVPDPFHVAQLLASAILASMLSDIGDAETDNEKPVRCDSRNEDDLRQFLSGVFSARLTEHAALFREMFLSRTVREPHPLLGRAEALEKSGTPEQAFALLGTLNPELLEPSDYGKWCLLTLEALVRLDLTDSGFQTNLGKYNEMRLKNTHDSDVSRKLAFIWIRYLQNRRDFNAALNEALRFSEEFPESRLSPSEKAVFSYLKGRNEYHLGEYIGALDLLDSAFSGTDGTDLEFRSDILNTAASCFTDNLFFDHASCLLQEALRIREQLALAKKVETLSAMGCLALKRADFAAASDLFALTLREMRKNGFIEEENRILNYAAKAYLYNGDDTTASELIGEALEKAGDNKRNIAFSNSIKMAFLVRKENFAAADALFRETFLLPENHSEIFATAWAYFFEAEACYRLGRKKDAVQYQARSVHFFLSDRYVLEAGVGSIVPILWDLSAEETKLFERLLADMDVLTRLLEYEEAHNNLPERFFQDFFEKNGKSNENVRPHLKTFIQKVINSALTKNPEKAREVLYSVCLL